MTSAWNLPDYIGPYTVGTRLMEVPIASCDRIEVPLCPGLRTLKYRTFYPTCASSGDRPKWASDDQIAGFANFAGIPSLSTVLRHTLSYFLSTIELPALSDAPLASPKEGDDTKWPVIVFSHGLGGTDTSYSTICGNLASYGFVVFAIEHRDHSASSSIVSEAGTAPLHVEYISPVNQDDPELRKRAEYMLQYRNLEMRLLIREIQRCAGQSSPYQRKLNLDTIILAGHSFGAATCLHLIDSINSAQIPATRKAHVDVNKIAITVDPKAAILFDIWTQPLPQTLNLRGMPILNLVSTEFSKWAINHDKLLDFVAATMPSADNLDEKLVNAQGMEWKVIKDSLHLSQSDGAFIFPRMIRVVSGYSRAASSIMSENIEESLSFLAKHNLVIQSSKPLATEVKSETSGKELDSLVSTPSHSWLAYLWPHSTALQTVQ